jgi:glycosyltransferase involved in cell wall biosynthesis
MSTPEISLVMPCYNRAHDMLRALQAYDRQLGDPSFELIAVDDGSNDDTYELLHSFRPLNYSIQAIRQESNQGPAVARNVGISRASAPLVLFVGDDILPDPYFVKGHIAAHRFYPAKETAILGKVVWPDDLPVNTLMVHIDGIGAQQFSYHYLRDGQTYDFRHFYTANISLKKALLDTQPKWFDPDFPHAAFEDIELSFRLTQAGMRIVYLSSLVGYHYHYHNIWTFSNRQFKAGMMASVVVNKQPAARDKLVGRFWTLRLLRLILLASLRRQPEDDAERLEHKALHLVSAYEWKNHLLLDQLYLRLLSYYYHKGMIFGSLGDTPLSRKIGNQFARRVLTHFIARYSNLPN